MALLHRATLSPTKLELLTAWLPSRPWFDAEGDVTQLGAYRFDDPAGQVGIEAILVQTGGAVVHVPLTYRDAPLPGADDFLIGTAEHSVLGNRWVYDACGDPVWAAAMAETIRTGETQADEVVNVDGELVPRAATVRVQGSGGVTARVPDIDVVTARDEGSTTVVATGSLDIIVIRVLGADVPGEARLTGTWAGGDPTTLAVLNPR